MAASGGVGAWGCNRAGGVFSSPPRRPERSSPFRFPPRDRLEVATLSRSLVIVESPAKAKTVLKHLGKGFSVKASTTEVPRMTTKAVVNAITAIFLANGLITFLYYF